MSEETKKEAQDTELSLEELDKVAGGVHIESQYAPVVNVIIKEIHCPYCSFSIQYRMQNGFIAEYDMEMHIMENHERQF